MARIESSWATLSRCAAHRSARSRYSMRPFPSFPITNVPAFALNSFR